MFKRILPFLLIVTNLLLDTSVLPVLTQHWAMPIMLLTTVIVLGLLLGASRGLMYGMAAGVLLDVLVSYPFGLMSILYTVIGYVSGVAGRRFQRYLLTVVLTPILCLMTFEGVMAVYQFMAGQEMTWALLRNALTRVFVETVLAQLMYLLYNVMLRPSWSRYAAR